MLIDMMKSTEKTTPRTKHLQLAHQDWEVTQDHFTTQNHKTNATCLVTGYEPNNNYSASHSYFEKKRQKKQVIFTLLTFLVIIFSSSTNFDEIFQQKINCAHDSTKQSKHASIATTTLTPAMSTFMRTGQNKFMTLLIEASPAIIHATAATAAHQYEKNGKTTATISSGKTTAAFSLDSQLRGSFGSSNCKSFRWSFLFLGLVLMTSLHSFK